MVPGTRYRIPPDAAVVLLRAEASRAVYIFVRDSSHGEPAHGNSVPTMI